MSPLLVDFLGSSAATVAAAAAITLIRELRRVSKSVGESAAAVTTLTDRVSVLVDHDEQTRERVATIEGALRWQPPDHHPWSTR